VESTWLRSLQFSSEGAAQAWNESWERVATDRHFTYPVLLSMNGAPIGDPATAFVAHIASRVMHEEIRGGTPVPGVSAGWQVELALSHAYETMPAPWMSDSLVFTASWSVLDASGEALWCVDCAREYDARHLPPNAPHLLTAKPRLETLEVMSAAPNSGGPLRCHLVPKVRCVRRSGGRDGPGSYSGTTATRSGIGSVVFSVGPALSCAR